MGNYNRSQLEQKFALRQTAQNDENKEILGINNKTILTKKVVPGESQESFLCRTYAELADKAGISGEKAAGEEKSPKEKFVEERVNAQKDKDGIVRMGNLDTPEENDNFSNEKWKTLGSVAYHVGDADVETLKRYKAEDGYNQGAKAAQTLKEAINRGYQFSDLFNKVGDYPPDVEKAVQTIRTNQDNANFQDGVLKTLGADDFIKAEKYLAGSRYEDVLRNTLSITGNDLKQGAARYQAAAEIQTIQKEIAQKSDVETLARLVGDQAKPMGKDFLIEAGKKATTPGIGWKNEMKMPWGTASPTQVEYSVVGADSVLEAVSRSPQASLELLQDESFVKNSLRMTNMAGGNADKIVGDIIRNGATSDFAKSNADSVRTAIKNLSAALRDESYLSPDTSSNAQGKLLDIKPNKINEKTALALADVYVKNAEMFSEGAGTNDSGENLSSNELKDIMRSVQPYHSVKDEKGNSVGKKMALATAVEYNKLLLKAKETGDNRYTEEAANLVGNYVNNSNKGNIENAKEAEARRELFAKLSANVLEIGAFNLTKATGEIVSDLLGKVTATGTETRFKGKEIEDAEQENEERIKKQQTTNSVTVVQVFEADEYAVATGMKQATPEQKKNAEKFISDLRAYNESLSANGKILDANGRLINPSQMTGTQRQNLERIFVGDRSEAGRGLYDRMKEMRLYLRTEIEQKLH